MIKPKLELKVVKRGTHLVKMEKINDDVPSPAACVAESLADLEYRIGELVKIGGYNAEKNGAFSENAHAFDNLLMSVNLLNSALNDASKQNWQLELEQNSEKRTAIA